MKNAAIFASGVATGVAGFAILSVSAIGIGLIFLGIQINRDINDPDNPYRATPEGLTIVE
jgi:hypothetical protein